MVKGLDDHFAESLDAPITFVGLTALSCTDQDKAFTAINQRCIGCFICTDGIVLDCLCMGCPPSAVHACGLPHDIQFPDDKSRRF